MSAEQVRSPSAPRGLKAPGRAFWRRVTTNFELNEAESVLLEHACRSLDGIAELEGAVAMDGTTVTTKSTIKIHPAIPEIRQQRAALSRLLAALNLPDDDSPRGPHPAVSAKARRAAMARWRPHQTEES